MPLPRKLSDDQVREIRDSEEPNTRLAAQYGVHRRVIQRVKQRQGLPGRACNRPEGRGGDVRGTAYVSPHNAYVLGDDLSMLEALPDSYAETVVAAASRDYDNSFQHFYPRRQEYGPGYEGYVDYHQAVINQCLRVAGPGGVVFFHVRHHFNQKNLEMSTWDDLVNPFPLRQVITWEHSPWAWIK